MTSFCRKAIGFLFFSSIFVACNIPKEKTKALKIKLIQTTDVHGVIFPFDLQTQQPQPGSLARVYQYTKDERAKTDQEVVLLDNGDIMQGTPLVYYSNYVATDRPHILSQVMNFMGYDAATIGNHDIEAGHEAYDKMRGELNFPLMGANAMDTALNKAYFEPYTVIERQGVRIAILGLVTPGIPNWLPEKLYAGMRFDDMVNSARHWAKIIQAKEKPDLLIGLFHSGVDPTYGGAKATDKKNENAALLIAQQVPGFDVIFAGHDHRETNQVVTNSAGGKVLLIDPGSQAQKIGVADIELNWDENLKVYHKKLKSSLVDMANVGYDSLFTLTFEPFMHEVEQYVNKPIVVFNKPVRAREALFGSSAFVDFVHEAQLELTGADVSFAAPLSLTANIDSGRIFVRDMFSLYKYENFLYTMRLTGQEIKDALEFSYDIWFNRMRTAQDTLLSFKRDRAGKFIQSAFGNGMALSSPFFNFDSAAGILYTVDVTERRGHKVAIQSFADGRPFDMEKEYVVAVNSYRGNGGGGHFIKGSGITSEELAKRVLTTTTTDLRFNIMQWLEKKGTYAPRALNNWKLVPDELVVPAMEKSKLLFFGHK